MPLSATTRLCGIMGWPVKHSLSPAMQQAAFDAMGLDWAYVAFPVPPEKIEQALRALPALGIAGVNCTIPHKEAAAAVVDEIEPAARAIGAVNTITVLEDGRLHGINTDAPGFIESLIFDGGVDPAGKTVALLGSGGAGRAMAFALAGAGVKRLMLINRTLSRAQALAGDLRTFGVACEVEALEAGSPEQAALLGECGLLVNSTSLGLREGDPLPADPAHLPAHAAVYDAVYVPQWTPLLKAAKQHGLHAIPGLGMLARQGALSFEVWTGRKPDVDLMLKVLREKLY